MGHLDAEEANARGTTKVVTAADAVAWLHDLPALWAAADDSGRRLQTEALFEKVEVLGVPVGDHPPDVRSRRSRLVGGPRIHGVAAKRV